VSWDLNFPEFQFPEFVPDGLKKALFFFYTFISDYSLKL
jgi:hypothetical protein